MRARPVMKKAFEREKMSNGMFFKNHSLFTFKLASFSKEKGY